MIWDLIPAFVNVPQDKVEKLHRRLVVWEVAPGFDVGRS
jgi:hypothetical protein